MNKAIKAALVMGAAISVTACASVTRGTKQTFYIQSEPSGGQVTTTTGNTCVTPCRLRLKRKTEFTATVTLPGYKPGTAHVDSSVSAGGVGGTAGNILLGGVIGIVVDGASGAMQNLTPNPLKWTLAPEGSADETKVVPGQKPREPGTRSRTSTTRKPTGRSNRTEAVPVAPPQAATAPAETSAPAG